MTYDPDLDCSTYPSLWTLQMAKGEAYAPACANQTLSMFNKACGEGKVSLSVAPEVVLKVQTV